MAVKNQTLVAHAMKEQWGATFEDRLYSRADGTFKLDMTSDHPDFEDETFELSKAEAGEWIENSDGRDW